MPHPSAHRNAPAVLRVHRPSTVDLIATELRNAIYSGALAVGRATSLPGFTGRGTSVAVGSLTCPHPPQRRDTSWYSVTFGGGGGWTSTTWRRTRAVSAASFNDFSHRAQ